LNFSWNLSSWTIFVNRGFLTSLRARSTFFHLQLATKLQTLIILLFPSLSFRDSPNITSQSLSHYCSLRRSAVHSCEVSFSGTELILSLICNVIFLLSLIKWSARKLRKGCWRFLWRPQKYFRITLVLKDSVKVWKDIDNEELTRWHTARKRRSVENHQWTGVTYFVAQLQIIYQQKTTSYILSLVCLSHILGVTGRKFCNKR